MGNDAITLQQLQLLISNAINRETSLRNVWVKAEFSDLRVVGGHCYMELLEKDTAGGTRAKIRAMIWAGTLGALRQKFRAATGREIASGMKVLVKGSAAHHPVYGLSFTISDIDPSYTLGDMERLRREILERLAREGIINLNKHKELPPVPQRIAVVSAPGAAGYGDFMNQIVNNADRFAVYPMLFPAVMQGERTAPSVLAALDRVEMTLDLWDAVVIIRGGGATTDLNGFDNYDIARRVATFPIPVIVGIGHERDRTVLDEIACVRCKTPTAVAAFIIDSLRNAYTLACDLVSHIAKFGADALKGEHLRITNLSQTIPALAKTAVMREKMHLSELTANIPQIVKSRVMRRRMALTEYAGRISRASAIRNSEAMTRLERTAIRLENAAANARTRESQRLKSLENMLRVLSPENTLRRGYSITRVDGRAVTDPAAIPPGACVETTLANGKMTSIKQ